MEQDLLEGVVWGQGEHVPELDPAEIVSAPIVGQSFLIRQGSLAIA